MDITIRFIELILIICGFHICKFAYLLNLLVKPQINTCSAILDKHGVREGFELTDMHIPNQGQTKQHHCLFVSGLSYCQQASF